MSQLNARVLGGRYQILDRVGRGGMGAVWRARDELLGREVAVKEIMLPPGLEQEQLEEARGRAVGEARAAAQVRHPSVVTIHDVVMEGDDHWIVMEYIKARSLEDHLQDHGALPVAEAARIGGVLVGALQAVHGMGILHRDIKPANILLDDDGHVVLTDFGIATIEGDTRLTASGFLIGTPGYMAPERLKAEPSGPPSDLWSLGAVLYTAVEGRPPYEGNTPMMVASAILTQEPAPLQQSGPLGTVIRGLLKWDPDDRMDARTVADHLAAIAEGRDLDDPAGSPPPPAPQPEHSRQNPPGEDTEPAPAAVPEDDRPEQPDDPVGSTVPQVKYRTRRGPVVLAAAVSAVLVAVATAAISMRGTSTDGAGSSGPTLQPQAVAGDPAVLGPSEVDGDPSLKSVTSSKKKATASSTPKNAKDPKATPQATKKPAKSEKPTGSQKPPTTQKPATISLRARSNKLFVTLEPRALTLIANNAGSGSAEKFDVTYLGGDDIRLKARTNGMFVTVDDPSGTKPLIVNRDKSSEWETFLLVRNSDGSVSLLSRANNMYVSANNGGSPLIANQSANNNQVRFDLVGS